MLDKATETDIKYAFWLLVAMVAVFGCVIMSVIVFGVTSEDRNPVKPLPNQTYAECLLESSEEFYNIHRREYSGLDASNAMLVRLSVEYAKDVCK